MAYKFFDFLGDVSGWRPRCLDAEECLRIVTKERDAARLKLVEMADALVAMKEKIRQLELLVPLPAPPPLTYVTERSSAWIQDQIDSMDLGIERFVLDSTYRMTNQSNTLNIILWDLTDTLPYIVDLFDCENYVLLTKALVDLRFKVNHFGVVLDYVSGHSYIVIVYPDGNKSILETQSDGIYAWTKRPQPFYWLKGQPVLL